METKKIKFLTIAFALLMGISFTSCLKSDSSESTYDGMGFVRVGGYGTYFYDSAGNKLYPTSASLLEMETNYSFKMSTTNLAYIVYKLVDTNSGSSKAAESTSKNYNVKLVSAISYDGIDPITVSTSEELSDVTENAPIVTLKPQDSYGSQFSPLFFDSETLIIPIQWRMENKTETFAQHKVRLVYVEADTKQGDTNMILYLRHDRGTDEKTDVIASSYEGYNISSIIYQFKSIAGASPKTITVKAKEASTGSTLPDNYTEYSLDYKY